MKIKKLIGRKSISKPNLVNTNWKELNVELYDLCNKAEDALSKAKHSEALKILSNITDNELSINVSRISARLSEFNNAKMKGILTVESRKVQANEISDAILELISSFRKSFENYELKYKEIFEYLKSRYSKRLNQKLANRQPINIRRVASSIGTTSETSDAFLPITTELIQSEILKIFQASNYRMLVVGEPGTGKTCLLLQLVLMLLETERFRIPVVLNLATWDDIYVSLEDWLVEILPNELGVNKSFARNMVKHTELILLLDGFDEIREENRLSCLNSIGKYGEDRRHRFVISSRIEEYTAVNKDADVHIQIKLDPLTFDQINSELESASLSNQPEAKKLLVALKKNNRFREVVKKPFYFNILQLWFAQGRRLSEFDFSSKTIEEMQTEVLKRFVEEQLASQSKHNFNVGSTQKWLSFLAYGMSQKNLVVFELGDLQYDWWDWTKWEKFWGRILCGLVESLVFGLVFGLVIILEISWFHSIPQGLIAGLFFYLTVGLFIGLNEDNPNIKTKDQVNLSPKKILKYYAKNLFINIFFILVFGLAAGIAQSIVLGTEVGIVAGLAAGLVFCISFGLFKNLKDTLDYESSTFIQIIHPYQRFLASAKSLHFSIILHTHLRFLFYKHNLFPLKLVKFLNQMSKLHLLESDGATWRFRHRLIQEYFANLWDLKD